MSESTQRAYETAKLLFRVIVAFQDGMTMSLDSRDAIEMPPAWFEDEVKRAGGGRTKFVIRGWALPMVARTLYQRLQQQLKEVNEVMTEFDLFEPLPEMPMVDSIDDPRDAPEPPPRNGAVEASVLSPFLRSVGKEGES